ATGTAEPVGRAWNELPEIPKRCQWANFLRNHDELSLDQLTEDERERVYRAFAPDEDMRAYGRGIRRRLAPMLGGDQRRVELMYSLLFSTPDTPILNAGEELGLGDDLRLKERESSRTPMQWSGDEPNAGFSTADPSRLVRPVVTDGPFAFGRVNVAAQERDPRSLLHFVRHAVRTYKANPAFGRGAWTFLSADDPAVLVHRCELDGHSVYAVHNLSCEAKAVQADLPDGLADVFHDTATAYEPIRGGRVHLRPYGYRWLRPRE
ncbi:MAG: GH13_16, partial [uncultured Phycisphaerae bacterium]